MTQHAIRPSRRAGFTMIEILIVIVVIGILVGIGLAVGQSVAQGSRVRATQNVLQILNASLDQYQKETSGTKFPKDYRDSSGNVFPIIDGRPSAGGITRCGADPLPSVALYMVIASDVPAVADIFKQIDAKFIRRTTINFNGTIVQKNGEDHITTEILDGWGRPIRFVHPAYQGGYGEFYRPGASGGWTSGGSRSPMNVLAINRNEDFSRSAKFWDPDNPPAGVANPTGDADEGICPGSMPYFYSAGPDGDPGTRDDNIYTTRPSFPSETTFSKVPSSQ